MKTYHVKRLQRTLDNIHAQLKRWKQGSWMESPDWKNEPYGERSGDALVKIDTRTCGTAGCLAGWGAVDAGARFVAYPGEYLEYVAPRGKVRAVLSGQEGRTHVRYFARKWFGLTDSQAFAQFDSDNTYHRLWAWAMLFTGGRLTLPAEITEEQADAARAQGAYAYATDNFPAQVRNAMENCSEEYEYSDLDEETRVAAFVAVNAQIEARAKAVA